jgi:Cdc6-like AAA superfamily ATPase
MGDRTLSGVDKGNASMRQLTIPNKLYGRDRDIITLLESFERINSGQGEVLLVPGSSGIGKTALVQELKTPIRDRNGFSIKGKFDQYQQNIPYFVDIFSTLVWPPLPTHFDSSSETFY